LKIHYIFGRFWGKQRLGRLAAVRSAAYHKRIESISWSVRPLKERPERFALIFLVAMLGFGFGLLFFHNILMGLLGFAMILGSTMDQWLGATYKVDERGARSQVGPSVTEISWADVQRVLAGERSIRLSPLAVSGRTEAFRGVLLRTQAENHTAVLEFVAANCPAQPVLHKSASESF
jgi:hypothetical protein